MSPLQGRRCGAETRAHFACDISFASPVPLQPEMASSTRGKSALAPAPAAPTTASAPVAAPAPASPAPAIVFIATFAVEPLCGCSGHGSRGDSVIGTFASAADAKRAVRKSQFKSVLGEFIPWFYIGPWPGGVDAACAALKACEPDAEHAFSLSNDMYTEQWNADGTGKAAMYEEFVGCGSADRKWAVTKSTVVGGGQ